MDKPASKHPRNSGTWCPALSPDKHHFVALQARGGLIPPAGAGSATAPTSLTESFPTPGPEAADLGGCIFWIYFPPNEPQKGGVMTTRKTWSTSS